MFRHLPKALIAALAVGAFAAPAAFADSIAYIKDGDVWLASPDGARQVQVTKTGQYADVSQADDGTMIALTGVRLHRLDREGNVLADFDTPVSDTRPAGSRVFFGPYDPAISPDGTKLAYTYYYNSSGSSQTCFPPECTIAYNEGGTGYSWADRQTSWDDAQLGRHSGWRFPAWVDDDNLMLSNPTRLPNHDVVLDTLSDGSANKGGMVHNWFSDVVEGNKGLNGGDVTRDRRKLAFQTGENMSTLTLYAVPSFPTTFRDGEAAESDKPVVCYRYSNPDGGRFGVPTFAPGGARVAWHEGDGIHIADVPSFDAGCTTTGATQTAPLVIPGAEEPDWGPADVPAPKPADAGPKDGGAADNGSGAPGTVSAKASRTKLATALRRGLGLTVRAPANGRLAVTVKRGRRTVAKAPARRVTAGPVAVTATFTPSGRRALKRSRRAKLTIAVAFTPDGGAKQTVSLVKTLKR